MALQETDRLTDQRIASSQRIVPDRVHGRRRIRVGRWGTSDRDQIDLELQKSANDGTAVQHFAAHSTLYRIAIGYGLGGCDCPECDNQHEALQGQHVIDPTAFQSLAG